VKLTAYCYLTGFIPITRWMFFSYQFWLRDTPFSRTKRTCWAFNWCGQSTVFHIFIPFSDMETLQPCDGYLVKWFQVFCWHPIYIFIFACMILQTAKAFTTIRVLVVIHVHILGMSWYEWNILSDLFSDKTWSFWYEVFDFQIYSCIMSEPWINL
jgi:hypothetical protein